MIEKIVMVGVVWNACIQTYWLHRWLKTLEKK